MGRRRTGSGGGVEAEVEPTARVLESIRRTLARLVARPQVREVSEEERHVPVAVQATEALGAMEVLNGSGEGDWRPSPTLGSIAIPSAQAGGHDQKLLPSVRVALRDRAVFVPACHSLPPVGTTGCRSTAADILSSVETAVLPPAFLLLPSSPVLVQGRPMLSVPPTNACPVTRLRPPKVGGVRIPKPPAPRIRLGGDDLLGRMALTRWGRETPPRTSADVAFASERQRLAESVGLPESDVTLLGIYEQVPILAVSRIVVEEEGRRLRLWLKPDALRDRRSSRRITLLVGRRLSDGKMLQAAL